MSSIALSLATQAMAEEAGIQSGAELLVACSPTYTTPQDLYDQCLNFTVNEIGKLNLPETAVISDGQRIPCPTMRSTEKLTYWVVWVPELIRTYWRNMASGPARLFNMSARDALVEALRPAFGPCLNARSL